jgi:hypothetical protein
MFVYAPADDPDDVQVLGTYGMSRSAKQAPPDATCSIHVTDDASTARAWHASLLRGELPDTSDPKFYLHERTSKPPLAQENP